MSTALSPDFVRLESAGVERPLSLRVWRALLFCLLFSVIFVPEFPRPGSDVPLSLMYAKVAGGFRMVDVFLLALVSAHAVAVACSRRKIVNLPAGVAVPGLGFLICIAVAMAYGAARGGSNFFFDWRALALGMGLYVVWSFWLRSEADVRTAVRVFGCYVALRLAIFYAMYLSGNGEPLFDVSIPIFDGPILSCIVFAGLLGFTAQECAIRAHARLLWLTLAIAAYVMIAICLRRTYWAELAIGTLVLLLSSQWRQAAKFVVLAGLLVAGAVLLGSRFTERLESLDLAQTDTQFSADNADHVNDLADAWDQVRQSPWMGIGLGREYETWRIRHWKPESVMVHNAPLHVWLKYGLAGLLFYAWFHIALLRWLARRRSRGSGTEAAFLRAAFAYLLAQLVVTLGFAPWPYSELQMTTLISFLVAAAVASNKIPAPYLL